MKKSILIILLLVSLSACKEEETVSYNLLIFTGYPTEQDILYRTSMFTHSNTKVNIYESEIDYLLNQNIINEGLTDNEGTFSSRVSGQINQYWYKAVNDTLNNLRFNDISNDPNSGWGGGEFYKEKIMLIRLSTTPTKLEITVTDNLLNPIEGAEVQLYFSKQEYTDNKPAYLNLVEYSKSYGNWIGASEFSINNQIKPNFYGLSDQNGIVYFDNLEPRKYWIRVSSGALSNAQSVIETNGKLPDDPNITNTLSIMIQ